MKIVHTFYLAETMTVGHILENGEIILPFGVLMRYITREDVEKRPALIGVITTQLPIGPGDNGLLAFYDRAEKLYSPEIFRLKQKYYEGH